MKTEKKVWHTPQVVVFGCVERLTQDDADCGWWWKRWGCGDGIITCYRGCGGGGGGSSSDGS